MKYSIRITKTAEKDLISAADYIEFNLYNPQASDDLIDRAEKEISKLATSPGRHRLVDDPVLKAWGIRFVTINNYMAFYKVDDESHIVYIVRFLHGKRNWIDILKGEPILLD